MNNTKDAKPLNHSLTDLSLGSSPLKLRPVPGRRMISGRATRVSFYTWPESDAVKTARVGPRVVDSYSCRQMYLRSYTFSRKETAREKTTKCLGRVKEKVVRLRRSSTSTSRRRRSKKGCEVMRKMKEISCSVIASIFNRLLSCSPRLDVVGH